MVGVGLQCHEQHLFRAWIGRNHCRGGEFEKNEITQSFPMRIETNRLLITDFTPDMAEAVHLLKYFISNK